MLLDGGEQGRSEVIGEGNGVDDGVRRAGHPGPDRVRRTLLDDEVLEPVGHGGHPTTLAQTVQSHSNLSRIQPFDQ